MATQKTVSLVLGSGGARGLAHIGVINWLEENGLRIRSIAGSSIGALIGGIYAADKLDVYSNWVCALERMDVVRLLDFAPGRNALFKGERIINELKKLIGEHRIEDLPISFTAVATDLDKEKEVWLNSGSLFDAIRASIAIPTIFQPSRLDGLLLVDGGLVNPIPIAPTLNDHTDLTIAVNLSAASDGLPEVPRATTAHPPALNSYRERISQFIDDLQNRLMGNNDNSAALNIQRGYNEPGLFDVLSRSFDTMQNTVARFKIAAYSPDVIINIPHNVCRMYDFHRARELIAIGYEKAAITLGEHVR